MSLIKKVLNLQEVLSLKLKFVLSFKILWDNPFKYLELEIITSNLNQVIKVLNGCLRNLIQEKEAKVIEGLRDLIWEVTLRCNMDYLIQFHQDKWNKELILVDSKDSKVGKENLLPYITYKANGEWKINWTKRIFSVELVLQSLTIQSIIDLYWFSSEKYQFYSY